MVNMQILSEELPHYFLEQNMKGISKDPIGLTHDSGWQIGLRRTLPVPAELLWKWILSKKGIEIWLGSGPDFQFQVGEEYLLADGTTGKVRVYQPNSHWRITRQPTIVSYDRPSIIQVRIIKSGDKSVLSFHEEHLPSEIERQKRKSFYLSVMDTIKQELGLN